MPKAAQLRDLPFQRVAQDAVAPSLSPCQQRLAGRGAVGGDELARVDPRVAVAAGMNDAERVEVPRHDKVGIGAGVLEQARDQWACGRGER